jgi:hypothetical protein
MLWGVPSTPPASGPAAFRGRAFARIEDPAHPPAMLRAQMPLAANSQDSAPRTQGPIALVEDRPHEPAPGRRRPPAFDAPHSIHLCRPVLAWLRLPKYRTSDTLKVASGLRQFQRCAPRIHGASVGDGTQDPWPGSLRSAYTRNMDMGAWNPTIRLSRRHNGNTASSPPSRQPWPPAVDVTGKPPPLDAGLKVWRLVWLRFLRG